MTGLISNPGEVLREYMDARGITESDLARALDADDEYVSRLLSGEVAVSVPVANKLEELMPDTKAEFWLRYAMKHKAYTELVKEIGQPSDDVAAYLLEAENAWLLRRCGMQVDELVDLRLSLEAGRRDFNELADEVKTLRTESAKLRELIFDMHDLLQVFCESMGDDCPAHPDRTRQCMLRDVEDHMKELGFE